MTGEVGDPGRRWAAGYHRFEAASIIRESYPNATRVEFAAPGWHRRYRASVWTLYAGERDIWDCHDEHSDQLLRQDLITERLADAFELDPAALSHPRGPASGLSMDLDAALAAITVDAAERITDHMERLGLGCVEIAELVRAVTGHAPNGDALSTRVRLHQFAAALVETLGERRAWARLDWLATRAANR